MTANLSVNDKLEELLAMENEELFNMIGGLAVREQGLQGIESWNDKLKLGQNIFSAYEKQFRDIICGNKRILKAIKTEEFSTIFNVASLLVPLIAPLVIPGTAAMVGILIARIGILRYCDIP